MILSHCRLNAQRATKSAGSMLRPSMCPHAASARTPEGQGYSGCVVTWAPRRVTVGASRRKVRKYLGHCIAGSNGLVWLMAVFVNGCHALETDWSTWGCHCHGNTSPWYQSVGQRLTSSICDSAKGNAKQMPAGICVQLSITLVAVRLILKHSASKSHELHRVMG